MRMLIAHQVKLAALLVPVKLAFLEMESSHVLVSYIARTCKIQSLFIYFPYTNITCRHR